MINLCRGRYVLILIFLIIIFISPRNFAADNASILQTANPADTHLSIMRMGVEGISPDFDRNIMEYTLVVGVDTADLNITAASENPESKINIYGDKGLKTGLNKVQIEVVSEDGMQKRTYTVNVTKTSDAGKANANLQTLSIEYFELSPEFSSDITSYLVDVPNSVDKINIFAVPESMNAIVEVGALGSPSANGGTLIVGDNTITIKVAAEDGITAKNYVLTVHRQTEAEDKQDAEEEANNVKELETAYEQANAERLSASGQIQNKSNDAMVISIIALGAAIAIMAIVVIVRRKKLF